MGEQSFGEDIVIENGGADSLGHFEDFGVKDTEKLPEVIGLVESQEFRDTLLATHEGLTKIAEEGFHINVTEAGNKDLRRATFEAVKPWFSDNMVLYAASNGTDTLISDRHDASSLTAEVSAIAIQKRENKGVTVTTIRMNASKAYISVVELNDDVPFESVRLNGQGQLFNGDQVKRGEGMEIALNKEEEYPSESGSTDGSYHFLPEERIYHQTKLGPAVIETLSPLLDATRSSLSAQGYELPENSL